MPALHHVFRQTARFAWSAGGLSVFLCASIIYINDNILETSFIDGQSMSPTLSPDYHTTGRRDLVLWKKWNASANIQRGDVVLFRSPTRPEDNAVKRVIATEGDKVILDPRRRPSRWERDAADRPESRAWDALKGCVEMVPEGHVWVEGDYWRRSWDSNAYGPISKSLILGKAVTVALPWDKFGMKPWEGYKSRTKVVPGKIVKKGGEEDMGIVGAIVNG